MGVPCVQAMPVLRIANVLHSGIELLAIEHRGQLLSVPELDRVFDLEWSPTRFAEASSFSRRVFSLGLAGLDEVIECIAEGEPPESAILDPRVCMFLTPTVANPALLEFDVRVEDPVPSFRRGFGRCLRGHEAPLQIPSDETSPELAVEVAAILGDDLRNATPEQAQRAIIGYATLSLWTMPSRERLSAGWGRFRCGQLGPWLMVPDGPFDPAGCGVSISINGEKIVAARARPWRSTFAEMIAFASEGAELFAGDVIASGPLAKVSSDGARALRDGDRVSVEVADVGALAGVVVSTAPRKGVHCWAPVS
jgi:2-keto-4-pentenoate hydratase/2-oxohepta-3-ene-1,7-dioic acid hydratase in catechol pathway